MKKNKMLNTITRSTPLFLLGNTLMLILSGIIYLINIFELNKSISDLFIKIKDFIELIPFILIIALMIFLIKEMYNNITKCDYRVSDYIRHLAKSMLYVTISMIIYFILLVTIYPSMTLYSASSLLRYPSIFINFIVIVYLAIILTKNMNKRRKDETFLKVALLILGQIIISMPFIIFEFVNAFNSTNFTVMSEFANAFGPFRFLFLIIDAIIVVGLILNSIIKIYYITVPFLLSACIIISIVNLHKNKS